MIIMPKKNSEVPTENYYTLYVEIRQYAKIWACFLMDLAQHQKYKIPLKQLTLFSK